jgi:hypothetical protein
MMKGIAHICFFVVVTISSCFSQNLDNWSEFQKLEIRPDTVHAITYNKGVLAININNQFIRLYSIVNRKWESYKDIEIKWVWREFGTMRFHNDLLYVSIDGFKYYKINIDNGKKKKTNTYKAGFYIISQKDRGFFGKRWTFETNQEGNIDVSYNYIILPPGYKDPEALESYP